METKSAKLDAIKQQILDDKVCPELASQATQLVFGDGNPDADIVFIGEAPGKQEDLQGLPFVGSAGRLLNEMLESVDLSRDQVYITNIVKYRPPANRDPLPEEKKAFMRYLSRQLEVIRPKMIVALGRHAANCFLPDLKIGREHGKAKRLALRLNKETISIIFLPLFHPAAALYNGSIRQVLIDDFAGIPQLMRATQLLSSE